MNETKEWTLMFYFASDNPLAAEVVSQLKALKQAGFHPDVNVIAHFDPNAINAETHVFDINRLNKIRAAIKMSQATPNGNGNGNGNVRARGAKSQVVEDHRIGFVGNSPEDPFVANLMSDKLWGREHPDIRRQLLLQLKKKLNGHGKALKLGAGVRPDLDLPEPPEFRKNGRNGDSEKLAPSPSLAEFLTFCSRHYPARHYMLFILGHGLVVGNDSFLFDEHAATHFLKLTDLGAALRDFKKSIAKDRDGNNTGAKFELVSFHSCSMSSIEVAYEIRGTAKYMLASQSPAFVGSWPYRQILIRIFRYAQDQRTGKGGDVKCLLKKIFFYCLYNSLDFVVAGYSFDVCLCDLRRVSDIKEPLAALSATLIEALKDPRSRECILLAHWDAQSYWQENYADLYDFCFCLRRRVNPDGVDAETLPADQQAIWKACDGLMSVLQKGVEGNDEGPVVRSEFAGPACQYANGLSVYFPWSQPVNRQFFPNEYARYKFVKDFRRGDGISWMDFLNAYFKQTRRETHAEEQERVHALLAGSRKKPRARRLPLREQLLDEFAISVFNQNGQLSKGGPTDSAGDSCDCQSIKNYPSFMHEPRHASTVSKTFFVQEDREEKEEFINQ